MPSCRSYKPPDRPPDRPATWETDVTPGPAKLCEHLALQAVEDHLIRDHELPANVMDLVLAVVQLSVEVTCRAAEVAPSWESLYNHVVQPITPGLVQVEMPVKDIKWEKS